MTPSIFLWYTLGRRMLKAIPITLKKANEFVEKYHRHHKKTVGHKFSVGVEQDEKLVGVAIGGRPVARGWDYNTVCEVTRVCTDGTRNACSFLYGRMAQIAKLFGYKKIITYTLISEDGASLRGAGWAKMRLTQGGSWNSSKRPREDKHPLEQKIQWEKQFG